MKKNTALFLYHVIESILLFIIGILMLPLLPFLILLVKLDSLIDRYRSPNE